MPLRLNIGTDWKAWAHAAQIWPRFARPSATQRLRTGCRSRSACRRIPAKPVQPATWWQWLAGYVVRAGPETGDKYTRAQPMAAQAAAGNVRLVQGDWTVVATLWWSFSSSANRRASLHPYSSPYLPCLVGDKGAV